MSIEITEEDLVPPPDLSSEESLFEWDTSRRSEDTHNTPFSEDFAVLRNKIATSPIVKEIYQLKYSVNKLLKGLEAQSSSNDGYFMTKEMLHEFMPPDPDSFGSQMDDMDDFDDDLVRLTTAEGDLPVLPLKRVEDAEMDGQYVPELEEITVFVHESSIAVADGSTFELPTRIRSSNVLQAMDLNDGTHDEDSLVLSLASRLLILVRFFQVDGEVKPYVVQWWRTSHIEKQIPKLSDVGREIITHPSGKVMALTSMQNIIRLYYCSESPRGIMLDKLHNLVFDGTILYTCFLDQLEGVPSTAHTMVASMMITSGRRYIVRLFEWWIDESRITEHTPLLLPNHFELPVFTLPFKKSILMMMEKMVVLVSVNNILSADYNFIYTDFHGSFPVSYYRSSTAIIADAPENEVLIATEDGTLYSIVIYDTIIHIRPILKVPTVDKFTLEKKENGYHFMYTSNITNSGYIIFEDVIHDAISTEKIAISKGEVMRRWDTWAPLWDVEVIDTRDEGQQLWMIHGKSISRMKRGLSAWKELNDPSLKSALKVYHHVVGDDLYFVVVFVDKTFVLKLEDESLVDVSDSGLDLTKRTIHIASLESFCFQITEDSIVISDFQDEEAVLAKVFDYPLIYADTFENVVVTLMERPKDETQTETVLKVFQVIGDVTETCQELVITSIVSFVKLILYDDTLLVVIASESKLVIYRKDESLLSHLMDLPLDIDKPHDLIAAANVIYISSRTGVYSGYSISGPLTNLNIQKKFSFSLCNSPIDFVMGNDHLILICKGLWKLPFGSKFAIPIILEGASADKDIFSVSALGESTYALIREDGLSVVNTSKTTRSVLKTIKLGVVPRKMKYISHLGVFAIITERELLFASKYAKLEDRVFSKKNTDMFGDEKPLCLCEWYVPSGQKKFRNLLIGCSSEKGGSITVLNVKCVLQKGAEPIVDVYELYNVKTPGAVLSIVQLEDHSILYSTGCDLYTCSYNLHEKKMNEPTQVYSFNSLVTSIDIKGDSVLVSTKNFAATRFAYENGLLILAEENGSERKVTNSLIISDNLAITTDKLHCSISATAGGHTKFKAYPRFVPKLRRCDFTPQWYNSKSSLQRFIAFGLAGDIQLYTMVDKEQKDKLSKYYLGGESTLPKNVTKKGLWEMENGPWFEYRDVNVFEHDRFQDRAPEDIEQLLEAVSI